MNPTFRFDPIDVLLNRNSLRKFFDFCAGRAQDTFRVNLFLVNSTLIIERCVRSTTEFLNASLGTGYGHSFERAVTKLPPELQDSSAHHRVLRYKLGGLECAVRFEVDASYADPNTAGAPGEGDRSGAANGEDVEFLEAGFSSMALGKSANTGAKDVSVITVPRGSGTPQASVAELKSSKRRPKVLPQLWFGRTRYLITGHHEQGVFDEVKVEDVGEDLEAWENREANQDALRKMAMLLSRLRDAVGMAGAKPCVAVYVKGAQNPLRVLVSTSGKGPLPDSVIKKFWKA